MPKTTYAVATLLLMLTTTAASAQVSVRDMISREEAEQVLRNPALREIIKNDTEWHKRWCTDSDMGLGWRAGCLDQCVESNLRHLGEEWKLDLEATLKRVEPDFPSLHAHCATECASRCEYWYESLRKQILADAEQRVPGDNAPATGPGPPPK